MVKCTASERKSTEPYIPPASHRIIKNKGSDLSPFALFARRDFGYTFIVFVML